MSDFTDSPHPEQPFIDRLLAIAAEHKRLGRPAREFEDYVAGLQATLDRRVDDGTSQGIKAMLLAPNLEICRALLRGERVHWTQLDYFNAQRYGVRDGRIHADGRLALDDFNDVRAPKHAVNGNDQA